MRKVMRFMTLFLFLAFLFPALSCAGNVDVSDDGAAKGWFSNLDFQNSTVTRIGQTASISFAKERSIQFQASDFMVNDGTSWDIVSKTTTPGLELDNLGTSLVWADGETTPATVIFKVPVDYASGGAFRVFSDESDSTTPNQVDFSVYVHTDGSPWDASATNQTPVALAGDAGSPDMVALSTIATDFDSLVAGQVVQLNLWRDDAADGTGDLEVYYAEFYYTSQS